jgi:hypothetical protein
MGGSKQRKPFSTEPLFLGLGVQSVACDYQSSAVGGGAAGLGYTACEGGREAEEVGKEFGSMFFDVSKNGGDLVDVGLDVLVRDRKKKERGRRYICVQRREEELRYESNLYNHTISVRPVEC